MGEQSKKRRCGMKRRYIKKIFKLLAEVDDIWVLNQVYKIVLAMTSED